MGYVKILCALSISLKRGFESLYDFLILSLSDEPRTSCCEYGGAERVKAWPGPRVGYAHC